MKAPSRPVVAALEPTGAAPIDRRERLWVAPTLLALFFLSGASALVYESLWVRLLALVFGVTVWAVSTVLACFMAGLTLGSFAAGRWADRVQRPLLWFGLAEGAVGASALATPLLLGAVE